LSGSAASVGRKITPLGRSGFSRDGPLLLTTETISETVAITQTDGALEGSAEPGSQILGKGITSAECTDNGFDGRVRTGSVGNGGLGSKSGAGRGTGSFAGKKLVARVEPTGGEEIGGLLLEILEGSSSQREPALAKENTLNPGCENLVVRAMGEAVENERLPGHRAEITAFCEKNMGVQLGTAGKERRNGF
jgi:hypothetical protein